jgi:hypothetical protein
MWRWLTNNHQTLTGIGAMLVGVAALLVAWDQGRVMRAQQHGAVYPVLQIDGFVTRDGDTQYVGARISNNGVGPAMIDDIVVIRDDEPVADFSALVPFIPEQAELNWSTMIGRVLAPGESVVPLEYVWVADSVDEDVLDALLVEWSRWDVAACYCSVFGKCWVADTRGVGRRPQPRNECPRPEEDLFEQMADSARSASSNNAEAQP